MYPPFGPFVFGTPIRWYGVILMSAAIIGALVAMRYVQRKGFSTEIIWDLLKWVLVPAIVGARLYFVFIQTPWTGPDNVVNKYLKHPGEILAVWHGGIHIYGALIFGAVALMLFARHRRLPLPLLLDAAGLVLPLSQAIGRWANFINQELYGPPTNLPWGLRIDDDHRVPPYDDLIRYPESTRFQPLFLYESLGNFIGFALIFWISRRFAKQLKPGDILLMYLIEYPALRFFLEFFRSDSWFFTIGGLHFNFVHLLSLIVVVISALALYLRHRPAPAAPDGLGQLGERVATGVAALQHGLEPALQRLDGWFGFLKPMSEEDAARLNFGVEGTAQLATSSATISRPITAGTVAKPTASATRAPTTASAPKTLAPVAPRARPKKTKR